LGAAAALVACFCIAVAAQTAPPQPAAADPRVERYKRELAADIDEMKELTQQMVDSVFSFGELGFQEIETGRYLTGILEKNGFRIERGVAGIPTAWVASWGSGKPVIALGSDIDGIPQGSQKPGVAYHAPLIEGAPGHGEGHNSGVPLNGRALPRSCSPPRPTTCAPASSRTWTSCCSRTWART
jgi:aminobenzoyl-glutamate utilization protein B